MSKELLFDIDMRDPNTQEEKALWEAAYRLGMKNDWTSGRSAIQNGDFIVEEDRLNKNSIKVIDTPEMLEKFFNVGNWCLGVSIMYKDLVFIQQVSGGDEWFTIKRFPDGLIKHFESISWLVVIKNGKFKEYLDRLLSIKSIGEWFGDKY